MLKYACAGANSLLEDILLVSILPIKLISEHKLLNFHSQVTKHVLTFGMHVAVNLLNSNVSFNNFRTSK